MKLTISERITLVMSLPNQGSFTTLETTRSLRKKVGIPVEDYDKLGIKETQIKNEKGQIVKTQLEWDKEGEKEVEIKIVRVERELILKLLDDLSKEEQATEAHMNLYNKIKKFHEKLEKKG